MLSLGKGSANPTRHKKNNNQLIVKGSEVLSFWQIASKTGKRKEKR
jgi:hypothetical protein